MGKQRLQILPGMWGGTPDESKACAGTFQESWVWVRRTPHPVIVSIRDNEDYFMVVLYSYYTTITGWAGFLLRSGDPIVRVGLLGRNYAEPYG